MIQLRWYVLFHISNWGDKSTNARRGNETGLNFSYAVIFEIRMVYGTFCKYGGISTRPKTVKNFLWFVLATVTSQSLKYDVTTKTADESLNFSILDETTWYEKDVHNPNLGFIQLNVTCTSTAQITTVLNNHHDQNEHQITPRHQSHKIARMVINAHAEVQAFHEQNLAHALISSSQGKCRTTLHYCVNVSVNHLK